MVTLPFSRSEESSLPRSVIVVEDDALLGLDIEQTLHENGIEDVTICPSASCTLERLRNGKFDAIVLDAHLADSDEGWKIAELVEAMGERAMRIVFQTGSPEEIPDHVRKLGPVLGKPYDPRQLIGALREKQSAGLLAMLSRRR
ncbi:response regulator [Erythrobacter sp.]|jgi:CheY-like chemotaxis protein|uniref:response regulator n=1 Tax=Erythrobacter sp. TaxID=1042 RepID=UPI002EC3FED0|nr:response regulator [Erythrobacter sp.]